MFYLHLPSVFDSEYCEKLIEFGQFSGFTPSAVNMYGSDKIRTDIRNNSRLVWDDVNLARKLESKIILVAGEKFPITFNKNPLANSNSHFAEFGSHFRMYKYSPNEYFKPHKDGSARKEDLESLITVLIYLNNADGGETVLMPNGFMDKESWITITPHVGDVLMFQHNVWHEGKPVKNGEKFVLRTDLFYTNT